MRNDLAFLMLIILAVAFAEAYAQEPASYRADTAAVANSRGMPKDVARFVTVITAEEIRALGATDISEAVRSIVGVQINDQGAPGSLRTVGIRGANAGQTLVMVDGMRLNASLDGGCDLSALPVPLDDIDRIEIARGSSSALYGTGAVGGVVNIITKKPGAEQNRIGGSIGSNGFDTITLGSSTKQGNWYYSLSGLRETYDGYRVNNDLRQETFGGKIGYDISKTSSLELTANYTNKENGSPGNRLSPTEAARRNDRIALYGLSYKARYGTSSDVFVLVSRKEETLRFRDSTAGMYGLHESMTDGGEARLTVPLGTWNLLTAGVETREDRLTSSGANVNAVALYSEYVQDEMSLSGSLTVLLGGRYDDHSVYGEHFSPRIGGRYLIEGSGTVIRASYSESFRGPTLYELYASDPGFGGNRGLKPETVKEYDAGIEQALSSKSTIKAAWFERKAEDLIVWQPSAPSLLTPANVGRANIQGIEAEASFRPGNGMSLSVNYTYANPVDETTGAKICYAVPKEQVKGSLQLALDESTYLRVEGRTAENYVQAGEPAWRYSVFDAKLGQRLSRDKGEIYFGMKNIFDRSYETVRYYPMPPKEIYGGLTYLY